MSGPSVSLCVPTYNRAEFLAESLRSLVAQTYDDLEVVVVDNCSDSDTARVVRSFKDPRVSYYRNETNLGSRRNWNRCLELAKGRYIAICHDDDLYDPQYVRLTVEMLGSNPSVGFVHTAVHVIDETGRWIRTYRAYPTDRLIAGREAFLQFLTQSHDVVFATVLARREAYAAAGLFEPRYLCADFEMWLRMSLLFDVAYLSTALVSYRIHHASTSLTIEPCRWYQENQEIVERAIDLGCARVPGLADRRAEILRKTRGVWARRTLVEALFSASCGSLAVARRYQAVARELAVSPIQQFLAASVSGLLTRPGGWLLRTLRELRRMTRRLAR